MASAVRTASPYLRSCPLCGMFADNTGCDTVGGRLRGGGQYLAELPAHAGHVDGDGGPGGLHVVVGERMHDAGVVVEDRGAYRRRRRDAVDAGVQGWRRDGLDQGRDRLVAGQFEDAAVEGEVGLEEIGRRRRRAAAT